MFSFTFDLNYYSASLNDSQLEGTEKLKGINTSLGNER